ncbi:Mitochondrial thiamine pyrophosphate carrier [Taenia crassiceps]|uniref:Mitochondrial thiamine pyrophosphate carrier n=1 Tax=Taenia crassiceps TaxID=6207 RepID=A0ABR4QBZ4_9CEST
MCDNRKDAIAGSLSGFSVRALTQPLDVIKIRFQLQVEGISYQNGGYYQGMSQALWRIIEEEGVCALWKGHLAGQFLSVIFTSSEFFFFNTFSDWSVNRLHCNRTVVNDAIAGGMAGGITTLVCQPIDVLRTRLAGQGYVRVYRGFSHGVQQMLMNEGPTSFWRGLVPALILIVPQNAIAFATYEGLKRWFGGFQNSSILLTLFSGGVAGCLARSAVYPLDVVKKRFQTVGFEEARRHFGRLPAGSNSEWGLVTVGCLWHIYLEEGFMGLFKGWTPAMIKAASFEIMDEHKSSQDSMSLVSVSSLSNASSIMLTPSQQRCLLDTMESVNHGVLVAQKRSVETALQEAQITSERDLKRARMEYHSLASEKSELEIRLKNLEQGLQDSSEINEELRKRLEAAKADAESRVATAFSVYKHEDGLAEKVDEMKAKITNLRSDLEAKFAEIRDLKVEMETLRSELIISERKRSDLQRMCEANEAALEEVDSLRNKVMELESANAQLKDQLEQAAHAPGNASSLLSRPDGSGLCLRSSSILHTTRMEQRIARLESENDELRRSEAQLVTVRAQLEDLNARLERANEWRDRALLAEERLAIQSSAAATEAVEEKRTALAQCQRENALLLSELGQIRSELASTSVELKSLNVKYSASTAEESRLKTMVDCFEGRFRRLNRRIKILQQERDMYRQFVTSYEDADATLASPAGELVHQFQQMVERISESLKVFHQQAESDDAEIERLIDEVAYVSGGAHAVSATDISSADLAISSTDRQTIQQLRETIGELEERLERLERDKQSAEKEVECMRACGAYDPDDTQVVHLLVNPADNVKRSREEEVTTLRKENAQLQQRIKILQDRLARFYESRTQGGAPEPAPKMGEVTMEVAESLKHHPDPLSEIQKLKSQLQTERCRSDRLMETFASVSSELREACALLFGYNLHVRQSGIYKVQLRPSLLSFTSTSSSTTSAPFIKFKRSDNGLVVMETTLEGESARDFLNLRLPIPIALARLLLLTNGVSSIDPMEQSTMLM